MSTAPPPPPSCVALIFVCPSIIAQVQLGQVKGVDVGYYSGDNEVKSKFWKMKSTNGLS